MSVNSFIVDKVVPVLELFHIPWPGGDPATLRTIAGRWHSLGQDLHQTAEHLNNRVDAVVGVTWRGDAADAFKEHWKQQYDAFQATAKNFAEVQKELDAYADEAEEIVKEIVEIALEIAETELAGAVLSVVTAGISELVATAAAGARVAKLLTWVEKFTALAEKAENAVLKLVKGSRTLMRIVKALSKLIQDGLRNSAMNLLGTEITKRATGQGDVDMHDARNALIAGGVAAAPGALGKGLGSLGRHGAPNAFEKVLAGDGLTGGAKKVQSVVSGAATSAAGTWAAEHDDPNASVGADTATSFVTGGAGAHYAGRFRGEHVPEAARPAMRNLHEIGANGAVYGVGGIHEGTVKEHWPEAGDAVTDEDGAVRLPRE
ncbi:WXG100 family type VII secretion target [Streptomyces chattanoogensis]|uniref:WXG100 family type VII secretion target n=1 Tax=Streptomyces chattanoogensis TaxID=66876 RepID=UPI0006B5E45D|nr:WXG100 family type VII secretion target [Streptomyces chattanoogensis]